jgi:hypothetical protein
MFLGHLVFTLHEIGSRFLNGHHGWNATMRSIIARNYVDFGLWETKFLPYKLIWPSDVVTGPIHWNHPPAVNLMVAAAFGLFGEVEWATRLPTVIASLALFPMFWFYGRTLAATDERRILLAVATVWLFMWTPIQILFGNMVNYEPPILFLTMLGWVLLSKKQNVSGILAFVGAVFIDWSACFLAAGAGLALLSERRWKDFLGLGASTGAMFGAMFYWLHSNSTGGGLLGLGTTRAKGVSLEKWFDVTSDRMVELFGWPLLVLAALGLVAQIFRRRIDPVVITFSAGPMAYYLVFKQAAYVHNFYLLLLMPAIVVSSAIAVRTLVELTDWLEPRLPVVVAGLLMTLVAGTTLQSLPEQHLRRYAIEPPHKAGTFPKMARLHEIEVFEWIHNRSERSDVVALHRTLRPSLQARYYLHRRYLLNHRTIAPPKKEGDFRFLVVARRDVRRVSPELQKAAQVLWAGDYLVFDFGRPGEPDIRLSFEEDAPSIIHSWLVSSLYPPFKAVERLRDEPSPRGR